MQKDKRLAILVNGLAVVIAIIMIVPALIFAKPNIFESLENGGITITLVKLLILLVGIFAYMILHELVHGITMKFFGTNKVKYGFTGLYAYAGSDDYYDKLSYVIIALAPIVVWGIVLLILNLTFGREWFWVVYFIQIINVSGAAGDMYVTYRMTKLPKDVLVNDTGVEMKIFEK